MGFFRARPRASTEQPWQRPKALVSTLWPRSVGDIAQGQCDGPQGMATATAVDTLSFTTLASVVNSAEQHRLVWNAAMVPGQRRYGQPGMRRARAAAARTAEPADAQQPAPPAPPAPPTSPAVAEAASPTASSVPKQGDLESTTGPWKFLASNGDYSRIALECDSSVQLSVEGKLYCTVADVAHVH